MSKKNKANQMHGRHVFEFARTTMGVIRLDNVKVDNGTATGTIKLHMLYNEPTLDFEYTIVQNTVLHTETKKKFMSQTLLYDFPQKLLPVKDVFDELIIQAAKMREN